MLRNTAESFGFVSKTLHWLIAALVIMLLIAGFFMDDIVDKSLRISIYNIHKITGISILFLMIVRLVWAISNPKPKPPPGTSKLMHVLEWCGHIALYMFVIMQPIFGWVGSVAGGYIPRVGDFSLSLPIEKNKALAKFCFNMHYIMAIILIVTISLHVLASIYHHVIRRDNVLRRMLP